MKLIATLVLIALVTLTATAQGGKFTIKGITTHPSEAEGKKAYLVDYNNQEYRPQFVDSAIVQNGKFHFAGQIDAPIPRQIIIWDVALGYVVVEPGEVNVELPHFLSRMVALPVGTPLNDKLTQFNRLKNQNIKTLDSMFQAVQSDSTLSEQQKTVRVEQIRERQKQFDQQHTVQFIIENRNNILAAMGLCEMAEQRKLTLRQFDSLWTTVSPDVQNYWPLKIDVQLYDGLRESQPGKQFRDFSGTKSDNKTLVKLSDHFGKGKWVLLDFWASSCGPCITQLPHVKKALEQNRNNLIVVGVNIWDTPQNFAQAVENQEMRWEHIKVEDHIASKLYGVLEIPQKILIAPDGTIVKRDLRGENMHEEIAQTIKQYKK